MVCIDCDVEWQSTYRAGQLKACWLCGKPGTVTPPEGWPKWTSQHPGASSIKPDGVLTL